MFHLNFVLVSNLNSSRQLALSGNIPTEVHKDSSNICNSILQDIWNCEILGKQYFPKNLKLAGITLVCKKKDPTLVQNHRPVSVLPSVLMSFKE